MCSAFYESDKVFYGKVLTHELVEDGTNIRYTIRVERKFKGEVQQVETVISENTSTRWTAQSGEDRVVFALRGHAWGLCSPIDEPAHAKETMRAILALSKSRQSRVEGEVVRQPPDGAPVAGARVVVSGARRSFPAVTDRQGRFSVTVPPGRYRVIAPKGFEPSSPYSREDVGGFDVARGQCAQFQLAPREAGPRAAPR